MRDGERPARLCTSRTAPDQPRTRADQRKRATAICWGSSGRRFKSCQPDTGQRLFFKASVVEFGCRTQTRYPNQLSVTFGQQTIGQRSSTISAKPPEGSSPCCWIGRPDRLTVAATVRCRSRPPPRPQPDLRPCSHPTTGTLISVVRTFFSAIKVVALSVALTVAWPGAANRIGPPAIGRRTG